MKNSKLPTDQVFIADLGRASNEVSALSDKLIGELSRGGFSRSTFDDFLRANKKWEAMILSHPRLWYRLPKVIAIRAMLWAVKLIGGKGL